MSKRAFLIGALSTFACESNAYLLGHVLGENFLGLHVRRMKVKHHHVDDIVLVGFVANCMTRQSSLDVDWLLPFAFSSGICFGRRCVGHGHSRDGGQMLVLCYSRDSRETL